MSRIKHVLCAAAVVAAPTLAAVAFTALPAAAANTQPPCPTTKTSVTQLVNRPDGGNHGKWALDTITRTVTFTKVEAPKIAVQVDGPVLWSYHAAVTDTGAFVTVNGKSPNAGVDLAAGTKGTVTGRFTADFTAAACFANFADAFGGDTYHGEAPVSTSDWVRVDWGGKDFLGTSINDDWSWTYKTCSESWLDAANNKDGTAAGAGDITGKVCPTPTATTGTSAPTSTATTGGGAVVVGGSDGSGSLPVTGTRVGFIAGSAIVLIAVGAFALVATRRHRENNQTA